MNKIAIYCRVSTEEQNNLNQIVVLKKFAEDRNLNYDLFEDVGSSRDIRPTKQKLINMIRSGVKYDSILVFSFDRWARNTQELLQDINEIISHGIDFISYSDGIDLKNDSIESLKILGAIYNFQLKLISERTILGLMRAKANGVKLGRPMGSHDKKKRASSGYLIKEAKRRRDADAAQGKHKGLRYYIDSNKFEDTDELELILKNDISHRIINGKKRL